jgi:16S rRNA G966 N2-methylase RsmD
MTKRDKPTMRTPNIQKVRPAKSKIRRVSFMLVEPRKRKNNAHPEAEHILPIFGTGNFS